LLNHSYVKGESAPEKELLGTSRENIFKINISCDPAKALSFPLKISLRLREFRPAYSLGVFRIRIHLIGIRIRIQQFLLNTDPDPDPIEIQGFDDQKWRKIYI
jgi:hypothetical protein